MGINVGSGWLAQTKEGKNYIQIVFDDVITNTLPGLKGVRFGLYHTQEKTSEKAPDFTFQAYVPKPKKEESENTILEKLEIPTPMEE